MLSGFPTSAWFPSAGGPFHNSEIDSLRLAVRMSGLLALAFAACLLADDARAIPEFESRPIETRAVVTAPDAVFETFLDRLMLVESGGRDTAANPRSTAVGPFQFIKSTFLDLVRRHYAFETDSFTEDEVLDLRVNRRFARRAAALYSRENLASLSAQGLVPTFGHLRLAFLVGPTAAVRLIKATPDTPAAEVLGAAVIRANPFMANLSASRLIARAERDISEDRRRLVTPAPPPRERVVARQPRPRVPGSWAPGWVPYNPETVSAACNRRLASCRRWIAMQANKGRVLSERARTLGKAATRVGRRGGRPGV